jgi:hypothetical protein
MASVTTTVRVTAAAAPPGDDGGCTVTPSGATAPGAWGRWGAGLALALLPWGLRRRRRARS